MSSAEKKKQHLGGLHPLIRYFLGVAALVCVATFYLLIPDSKDQRLNYALMVAFLFLAVICFSSGRLQHVMLRIFAGTIGVACLVGLVVVLFQGFPENGSTFKKIRSLVMMAAFGLGGSFYAITGQVFTSDED
ncbi:MAG: hypothetical protein EP343_23585 [Deltaproteobacteria bacterium]|nr:MAG: hypothetical protein EP343_23585 [Deltaproteobacteria bacterium]